MSHSKLNRRPRLFPTRCPRFEPLEKRLVFSTFHQAIQPCELQQVDQPSPQPLVYDLNLASTSQDIQLAPIVVKLPQLASGSYEFRFTINVDLTIHVPPPNGAPPVIAPPPVPPPDPADPLDELQELGRDVFVETFDSGELRDDWTEVGQIADAKFIEQQPGDQAYHVTHAKSEDRIILRKEVEPFASVYGSFVQTFPNAFDERYWNVKASRISIPDGEKQSTFDTLFFSQSYPQTMHYLFQGTDQGGIVDFPLNPGEPTRFSYYIKQSSTPGAADARVMLWRNNELIVDRDDLISRFTADLPTSIDWIKNYSGGRLGDPNPPLERIVDDILFITEPNIAPELLHQLAVNALGQP